MTQQRLSVYGTGRSVTQQTDLRFIADVAHSSHCWHKKGTWPKLLPCDKEAQFTCGQVGTFKLGNERTCSFSWQSVAL